MPLSKGGSDVLKSMEAQYGEKKGKSVFYASINKGNPGSQKWEAKKKKTKKHTSYPSSVMKSAKGVK
jgi:hypothetical protein